VLFHVAEKGVEKRFRDGMEDYRLSLPDDRRVLFDRYRLEDFAVKVVGIGSVGTRRLVALFFSPEGIRSCCNSRRHALRCSPLMRARASTGIKANGSSWGNG
jgi:hypothetical protein